MEVVHGTAIRSVTCHMESHSVTCYPTQVNTPSLSPAMQAGGMEGWVDLLVVDLIAPRPGVEPATFRSRVQRSTNATTKTTDIKRQSLCGSEVTWKIKQLEVEGHVPQCPIAGDASGYGRPLKLCLVCDHAGIVSTTRTTQVDAEWQWDLSTATRRRQLHLPTGIRHQSKRSVQYLADKYDVISMYHTISVLKTQAWNLYVHIFITYFSTVTNQFWLTVLFPVPVISHLIVQNLSKLFLKLLTEL